jgi:glycosyltransferase involved in cell wall biosynthesis
MVANMGNRYRVEFFGHVAMQAELRAELESRGAQVHAHFPRYLYEDAFRNEPLSRTIAAVREGAEALGAMLVQARSPAGVGRTMVLHPTVEDFHLQALAHALATQPQDAVAPLHLVSLTFYPGVNEQGDVTSARRLLNYRVALEPLRARSDVVLLTPSEEQRQIFADICGLGSRVALHAHMHFDAAHWADPAQQREARLQDTVLLYAGDAKVAKGFAELPRMVRLLLQNTAVHMSMHVGLEEGLSSPVIERTVAELRQLAAAHRSRIHLREGYLPEQQMLQLLIEAGLVVFNYQPAVYAERTSGLLWQAAAAGAPVAVVGESWLSREARRLCPRLGVFEQVQDLVLALARAGMGVAAQNPQVHAAYVQALHEPLKDFIQGVEQKHAPFDSRPFPTLPLAGAHGVKAGSPRPVVLFVDARLPEPNRNAGGHAAVQELLLWQRLGFAVRLSLLDQPNPPQTTLQGWGAERVEWVGAEQALIQHLKSHGREITLVYLTRFHVAERLIALLRQFAPSARVVLNVADCHFVRLLREADLRRSATLARHAQAIRQRELAVMSRCDLVMTYTQEEATLIQAELKGHVPIERLPWVAEPAPGRRPRRFSQRRDLLYLGGFSHAPNVDAMTWFVADVMPLLRLQVPGIRLRICGADMPQEVARLASSDVLIEGYVKDLPGLFEACRVFVAPLRFGAGLKGKIATALAAGLPTVASPVAAEGFIMPGELGVSAVVETPDQWAAVVARLHQDQTLWEALSTRSLSYAKAFFSPDHALSTLRQALRSIEMDGSATADAPVHHRTRGVRTQRVGLR